MVRFDLVFLLIFIITSLSLFAQDEQDTTKTKVAVKDSIIRIPLRNHGNLIHIKDTPNITIKKQDIQDINYTGLSDILQKKTPFYTQNQGSFGLFNSFSIFGAKPRSINFQFNGRNINDLDLGSLNPEQISTEFFESVEVYYGSDAIILGDNSAGALINFQEIRYNTEKPFTRLWFSEAGFEYLAADGVYSQNFARDWNFTLGFNTKAADGLYQDSWMNSWNFRGILRWNPSDRTSISLSENFTNHGIGTGGGVD
jgi:outer membrane cobalamin receptor